MNGERVPKAPGHPFHRPVQNPLCTLDIGVKDAEYRCADTADTADTMGGGANDAEGTVR